MTVAAAFLSAAWRMFAVTGESASGLRPPDAATFSSASPADGLPPAGIASTAGPATSGGDPVRQQEAHTLDPDDPNDCVTMKQIACVLARVAAQCVIVAAPEFGHAPGTGPAFPGDADAIQTTHTTKQPAFQVAAV